MRGSNLRSGRLPDHTGRTRVLTEAPADVPVPDWPLSGPSDREAAVWEAMWKRPLAVLWHEEDATALVALYVRKQVECEAPGSPAALITAMRGLADDLYLTSAARKRAGVTIKPPGETPASVTPIRRNAGPSTNADDALGVLARWRDLGTEFGPETLQYIDAVAELANRGVSTPPYEYLDHQQQGA